MNDTKVNASVKGVSIQGLQIPELKVTQAPAGTLVHLPLSDTGNQPVVIGNRVTDVAHFHPCRYEKITMEHGSSEPVTLFSTDQGINTAAKNIAVGTLPHTNSSKPLRITIETLDTEDCNFAESAADHETTVLDTQNLEAHYPDAKVKTSPTHAEVSFIPQYPYKLLGEDEYLAFFLSYFPIVLGSNMQQRIQLPVSTCAFAKTIHIDVFPDVAFAYHLQIGNPKDFTKQNKLFFRQVDVENQIVRGIKNEVVALKKGIDSLDTIQKSLLNAVLSPIVREILLDYIMLEGEKFGAGFHGYHTFTSPTTPTVMDYGKKYKWLPNTYIISCLVVSAAVDALILYLTRGRSVATKAVTTGQKIRKAYKKYRKIKRYYKTGQKIASGQFIDPAKPNGKDTEFIWPQIAVTNGVGYINDANNNVSIEYVTRVSAAPLFALQHQYKGALGSMIANITGITKVFDTAEQVNGLAGKLKDLADAKKDYQEHKDKKQKEKERQNGVEVADSPEEEKSFTKKFFKFKDIQAFLNALEKKIHRSLDKMIEDKLGAKAEIEMTLKGFFSAHYEFKFQTGTKTMELNFYDENGKPERSQRNRNIVSYGTDYGIDLEIKLQTNNKATQKWSKLTEYIPFMHLNDTRTEVETQGKVESALNFERTFTYSETLAQPVSTDKLIFAGVVLSLYVKVVVEKKKDKNKGEWETKVEKNLGDKNKPLKGVLLPGFTVDFDSQPIFENIIK